MLSIDLVWQFWFISKWKSDFILWISVNMYSYILFHSFHLHYESLREACCCLLNFLIVYGLHFKKHCPNNTQQVSSCYQGQKSLFFRNWQLLLGILTLHSAHFPTCHGPYHTYVGKGHNLETSLILVFL